MQTERGPLVPILLGGAFVWVAALHLIAGRREAAKDRGGANAPAWIEIGPAQDIPDGGGRVVAVHDSVELTGTPGDLVTLRSNCSPKFRHFLQQLQHKSL